jgi:hypothetical protein
MARQICQVDVATGVLLQILGRIFVFEAEADVGIRGEMKNGVTASHRLGERGQIQIVAFDQFEFWIFEGVVQKFFWPVEKLSQPTTVFPVGQQTVNEVAADKTRCAGDENLLHDRFKI